MTKFLLFLFTIIALLNLWAEFNYHETLILISKPLLLSLLSIWYLLKKRPLSLPYQKWLLAGLIFSLGGDTLLMFVENGPKNEHFFLFGLGSFLLAQLCYTICFFSYAKARKGFIQQRIYWALPFLVYLIGLLYILWPDLEVVFKLPVTTYAVAIVGMAIAAFNLKSFLSPKVLFTLMLGVLLFVLSDSLIAVNKFKFSIPYARVWIMSTYILGQYLIVRATIDFPLKDQRL